MASADKIGVAISGCGVIGKRVADAVACQDDMTVAGVCDVTPDWRPRVALRRGYAPFGASPAQVDAIARAGLKPAGSLDDLLHRADVVAGCTPKRVAAKNIETYRQCGLRFIVQGGEKHDVMGHSFVAEANYDTALGRESVRSGAGSIGKADAALGISGSLI
jgi:glyceraldehyde-3-phosphate dehydrogenase (NAD(P))